MGEGIAKKLSRAHGTKEDWYAAGKWPLNSTNGKKRQMVLPFSHIHFSYRLRARGKSTAAQDSGCGAAGLEEDARVHCR